MRLQIPPLDKLAAHGTWQLHKFAAEQAMLWLRIGFQVVLYVSELACPCTPLLLVDAPDFEAVEGISETPVGKYVEIFVPTGGTRFQVPLDSLYAEVAVDGATAGSLVRLSDNVETYWAVSL